MTTSHMSKSSQSTPLLATWRPDARRTPHADRPAHTGRCVCPPARDRSYGRKGNAELFLCYGFTLPHVQHVEPDSDSVNGFVPLAISSRHLIQGAAAGDTPEVRAASPCSAVPVAVAVRAVLCLTHDSCGPLARR